MHPPTSSSWEGLCSLIWRGNQIWQNIWQLLSFTRSWQCWHFPSREHLQQTNFLQHVDNQIAKCWTVKEGECFFLDPSKISVIPRARLSLLWRSDNWQDSLRDVQPHKSQIQLTPSDTAVKWILIRKYLWYLLSWGFWPGGLNFEDFFCDFVQFFRRDLRRGWTVNCEVFAQLQIFST